MMTKAIGSARNTTPRNPQNLHFPARTSLPGQRHAVGIDGRDEIVEDRWWEVSQGCASVLVSEKFEATD